MASLLAPLLSILITFGQPLLLIAFKRNLCAASLLLLLVKRKSTVFPSLSTALYKYIHSPFTLIYVSSILQLLPTNFLLFFNPTSINGINLYTHLCIVAWSTATPLIDSNSSISR